MSEELRQWLQAFFGTSYVYARTRWEENAGNAATKFCVIVDQGGPSPDVDDRKPRYSIMLIGPRNDTAAIGALGTDINALATHLVDEEAKPCGAAYLHATGEPVGPGFTTENRVWYRLDVEIIF